MKQGLAKFGLSRRASPETLVQAPALSLELSGPRLARALEELSAACEPQGGVERFVRALTLKAELFEETFGNGRVENLDQDSFNNVCAFVAPARRRVGTWLAEHGFDAMRTACVELLHGWSDVTSADARLDAFRANFPDDRAHRWTRDLGAEILHFTAPEIYPLATRWMWDRNANTGVLREIWYAADLDSITLGVPDDFRTFHLLRHELEGFLSENGVFRDVAMMTDLLCGQIYGDYVRGQGSAYLRADFSSPEDPMFYARRMLGLDGADSSHRRSRLKLAGGTRHEIAWISGGQ
ncbi:MAG: hypothetical protein HOJ07_10870 [Rhodospirillaceae bacterium]|jgi:hypothetical protein|nr:hypothetical protein [Rhodospirillaceae bacterium]